MNSINSVSNRIFTPPIQTNIAPKETQTEVSDGFVHSDNTATDYSKQIADLKNVAATSVETAPSSPADVGMKLGVSAAAAMLPPTAGAVAGVTVDRLLANADEINKGFTLTPGYINGYYDRRILPYMEHPTYTPTDDTHLYRGMLLNTDEIANIMENGLEVKFNQWQAAGGKGVYFSSSLREAGDYIFQAGSRNQGLGVVVEVEKGDYAQEVVDPVLNSTKTIYKAPDDVSKEKITNILIQGEYGFERLSTIVDKAEKGEIQSNEKWVSQFDHMFGR